MRPTSVVSLSSLRHVMSRETRFRLQFVRAREGAKIYLDLIDRRRTPYSQVRSSYVASYKLSISFAHAGVPLCKGRVFSREVTLNGPSDLRRVRPSQLRCFWCLINGLCWSRKCDWISRCTATFLCPWLNGRLAWNILKWIFLWGCDLV